MPGRRAPNARTVLVADADQLKNGGLQQQNQSVMIHSQGVAECFPKVACLKWGGKIGVACCNGHFCSLEAFVALWQNLTDKNDA